MKIAINGLGRIGRAFLKLAVERDDITISAINDLGDLENLAYLLRYDSAYGPSELTVETEEEDGVKHLIVGDKRIRFLSEKDPASLPWGEWGIGLVVEATGVFTKYEDARAHLDAGAERVVISAPAKGEPTEDAGGETVLIGINEGALEVNRLTSNASCTTNSSSPPVQIMHEMLGVEKAMLSTVHGYTATQSIVDGPSGKDPRRGRAAAANIIPTSTGAAKAVTKALTDLDGKFDGVAFRVPVIVGSIADITFVASRETSVEEVNDILQNAAEQERWQNVFSVTHEPLVSTDIVGRRCASIADLDMTRVVDGNLVKICAWYDNETGYTQSLLEHVLKAGGE